jgi:mitochondrial fission protein ELM1
VLGGTSASHRFEEQDIAALASIACEILASGQGLMVTPSRRTPPAMMQALRAAVTASGQGARAFIWDGEGSNPYAHILAHARAIVVTGDSVNMVGEAASTGAPVHLYEPTGGHPKMTGFLDKLIATGAARRVGASRAAGWAHESWAYPRVDATQAIAQQVVRRYRAFRGI